MFFPKGQNIFILPKFQSMKKKISLEKLTEEFTPVVEGLRLKDYYQLDLSVENKELIEVDLGSAEKVENYIQSKLLENSKKVAFGGYLENRNLYRRSTYFKDSLDEDRNIHLGVDIWCDAGTAIYSPLPGKIHSFQDNQNFGDYGPTIILEHNFEDSTFYTLYGHLSNASLQQITKGQTIEKGETIGYLGLPVENGDYAPHLHFQIILDLENKNGDYPGVCAKSKLTFYSQNCPDPNLLLKIT
jgi:murein DD-endopeptidase MepM/ murein hydrolase activator NlpD